MNNTPVHFAIGSNTTLPATSQRGLAYGDNATSGIRGTAVGVNSTAGEDAVAVGLNASAAARSVAIGEGANASGVDSIAFGRNAVASNSNSIAITANGANTAPASDWVCIKDGAGELHMNLVSVKSAVGGASTEKLEIEVAGVTYYTPLYPS